MFRLAALFSAVCVAPVFATPLYQIVTLGPSVFPIAISDRGQVVGSQQIGYDSRAFTWMDGTMQYLYDWGSRPETTSAIGVSENGVISGNIQYFQGPSSSVRGVTWNPDQVMFLDESSGGAGDRTYINAISRNGLVTGQADLHVDGEYKGSRAFFSNGQEVINLGTLETHGDHRYSAGFDVNSSGWVVGISDYRAFVWNGTEMQDLGTLGVSDTGRRYSSATDINERGMVVGSSDLYVNGVNQGRRGFLWNGSEMTMLPLIDGATSGNAVAINDDGVILANAQRYDGINLLASYLYLTDGSNVNMIDMGQCLAEFYPTPTLTSSGDVVGSRHCPAEGFRASAFLYRDGVTYDLNDLVPFDPDRKLLYPYDMNERGQIVALGINRNNEYFGYLLTPVPEPSSIGYLALGLMLYWLMIRLRTA